MWILRLAVQHMQRGQRQKISIIDPNRILKRNIYHAIRFHYALKLKRCFTSE